MKRSSGLSASLLEAFRNARRIRRSTVDDLPDWARTMADLVTDTGEVQGRDALAGAIRDAVDEAATRLDIVSIASTGMAWLGAGIPSVERVLVDMVASAEREVLITAYSVTEGARRLWEVIDEGAATGVRFRLVVNELDSQSPEAVATFKRLARTHPRSVELYDFVPDESSESGGLHAKLVVVDRRVALVGSANLSHHGLVAAHEMALVVQGPTAERIATAVDRLLRAPRVCRRDTAT